ncbi:hypothetical protein sS8_5154 [Methylocaldum marinum]|uniref:Uncharacterized protein n=1 Tax=Methylocaldum marinum TaxID=1432792 RepID=A0A250KZY1_9GAMM|nr:hypothetical protein sS8_5154 [Methylocaldum marinum]
MNRCSGILGWARLPTLIDAASMQTAHSPAGLLTVLILRAKAESAATTLDARPLCLCTKSRPIGAKPGTCLRFSYALSAAKDGKAHCCQANTRQAEADA